ncbi:MAG: hypothetical protein JST06_02080 [Bacteroidetes bacterium]|nr:hypothetical protein [Bacteroidota bacterium]MBS1630886.1 hypothetical protein [Bacteroidota bacterium]
MKMHEVTTAADRREFLQVAQALYRNDPNWIQPLDKDIEAVFDPAQNKFFKKGECTRWILKDEQGKALGRVAAFVNKQYKQEQATGGIGFFECVEDQQAAHFIFDHCRKWLQDRGMEAMDGPINFGERLTWWGLLVDGFHTPLYQMNYNPPYYQALFESYGFQLYFSQFCFACGIETQLQEKHLERHKIISKNPDYRAVPLKKTQLEKFAKDFTYVYNKAWAGHGGGKEIEERTTIKMFKNMKPVLDESLIWFTYYKDEPIAIWVNLPDLNQWFGKLHGKFGLLQKLYFLWLKKFGTCDRIVGLVFGIIPEYQGKGVDAFMIVEAAKVIQQVSRYKQYEMQWIGDFNPKMISIAKSLDTSRNRTLITYRYLFDRNKAFHRHPILG